MKETMSIPNDIEAEQAILGALIQDNSLIEKVLNILTPNTFYKPSHQHIFRSIIELDRTQTPIDEVTLGDKLRSNNQLDEAGGYAYLCELANTSPIPGNIVWYSKIIQEHAILRNLIQLTTDIGRKARDPEQNVNQLLVEAQESILKISETKIQKNTFHIKDVIADSFKQLEERSALTDDVVGISTGYAELDQFTNGLLPEALIIVAARPSMGKTALALNIVEYAHTRGCIDGASLIFTKEMSKVQIVNRMLISNSRVDNKVIKSPKNLMPEDWDKLAMATDKLSVASIFINKNSGTIDQIKHEARLLNRTEKNGLKLIVVDYIQLFKGSKKQPREQEISEITRELKNLAQEIEVPIIALSQLNRELEKRSDRRPQLSDLRESGAIEQDADIVMVIYRDEVYDKDSPDKGIAEIIIRKHREGPIGTVRLNFIGKYTKFTNLSRYEP